VKLARFKCDDGEERELCDQAWWVAMRPQSDPISWRLGAAVAAVILLCFGAVLTGEYLARHFHMPHWMALPGAPLVIMAVAGSPVGRRLRDRRAGDIIAVFLDADRCASCGYPLDKAVTEPDGCTICSECGAAWTLRVHHNRRAAGSIG
jgi:hypothetical protein